VEHWWRLEPSQFTELTYLMIETISPLCRCLA
jgi:hypothetical protein